MNDNVTQSPNGAENSIIPETLPVVAERSKQLPFEWEVIPWWMQVGVHKSDKRKPGSEDGTSELWGDPDAIDRFQTVLQVKPVNWQLLEEALGLRATVDSLTVEADEDDEGAQYFTATLRLIPATQTHRRTADDTGDLE